jgi:addiction module HigA family antidote
MDLIKDNNGNVLTIEAFHPGRLLEEEIVERGLLKKDVAKQLEILPHHLSEIFAGKRNISAKLALKLEKLLGVSAAYWAGLQLSYDLQEARQMEPA